MKQKEQLLKTFLCLIIVLFVSTVKAQQSNYTSNITIKGIEFDVNKDINEQIQSMITQLDTMQLVCHPDSVNKMFSAMKVLIQNQSQPTESVFSNDFMKTLLSSFDGIDWKDNQRQIVTIQKKLKQLLKDKSDEKKKQEFPKIVNEFQTIPFFSCLINALQGLLTQMMEGMMDFSNAFADSSSFIQNTSFVDSDEISSEELPNKWETDRVDSDSFDMLHTYSGKDEAVSATLPEGVEYVDVPYETITKATVAGLKISAKGTEVTFLTPVDQRYNVTIDDVYAIIDDKTGNQYMIRGGLPLNEKVNFVCDGKKILKYTLIFAPLKRSVDTISIRDIDNNTPGSNMYFDHLSVKELKKRVLPQVVR